MQIGAPKLFFEIRVVYPWPSKNLVEESGKVPQKLREPLIRFGTEHETGKDFLA